MKLVALAAVCLVGCAEEPETMECGSFVVEVPTRVRTLEELPKFRPSVGLIASTSYESLGKRSLSVVLPFGEAFNGHGQQPIQEPGSGTYYCPVLDGDVSVTAAGLDVPLQNDGGWRCLGGTMGVACNTPGGAVQLPVEMELAAANVVVRDGDYEKTFDLGDALTRRSIEAIGHASGMFTSGQPITVRYSHPADLAEPTLIRVTFTTANGSDTFAVDAANITHDTDSITFTPPPHLGSGRLVVEVSGYFGTLDVHVAQVAYLPAVFVP